MPLFGSQHDAEQEPLLPQHNGDTTLQANASQKLHTYQMARALSQGFMPSNEQTVALLHRAAETVHFIPRNTSQSGRALVRHSREIIEQLTAFLEKKNVNDRIQDTLWYLLNTKLDLDSQGLRERIDEAQPRSNLVGGALPGPHLITLCTS
jgi:hypothetical protein